MNNSIDITFDSHSDTPPGKDPDSFSPTLRNYHRTLWSKPLPSGVAFNLNHQIPKVLYHNSQLANSYYQAMLLVIPIENGRGYAYGLVI